MFGNDSSNKHNRTFAQQALISLLLKQRKPNNQSNLTLTQLLALYVIREIVRQRTLTAKENQPDLKHMASLIVFLIKFSNKISSIYTD
jgi:hypothetical protein